MMNKAVICDKIGDKRGKWAIFEELNETNEALDEAIRILSDLRPLLRQLPDVLTISIERADKLMVSVCILDSSLDSCIETASVFFEEIEIKLDDMQKSLLHDEVGNMHGFSKLATEVKSAQTQVDALIANAETEIYKWLASEGLFVNRPMIDGRIMEMVLNSEPKKLCVDSIFINRNYFR